MKLKEDVIGQRRRLAKYIKRLQRFASVLVDFRPICRRSTDGILGALFGSLFGCNFHLFVDSAFLVRDVFHGVLCDWTPVFGPFLARLLTVHFIVHFISDAT